MCVYAETAEKVEQGGEGGGARIRWAGASPTEQHLQGARLPSWLRHGQDWLLRVQIYRRQHILSLHRAETPLSLGSWDCVLRWCHREAQGQEGDQVHSPCQAYQVHCGASSWTWKDQNYLQLRSFPEYPWYSPWGGNTSFTAGRGRRGRCSLGLHWRIVPTAEPLLRIIRSSRGTRPQDRKSTPEHLQKRLCNTEKHFRKVSPQSF